MSPHLRFPSGPRRVTIGAALTALVTLSTVILLVVVAGSAQAAPAAVTLGTADAFAVLGGSTVTNTGPTILNGDLGVSPGAAVTGFPPGIVSGDIHQADAVAGQAQADTTATYNDLAGRPCDTSLTGQDLGGLTLTAGIYCFATSAQLTGTLTLNAQGNPNVVFIFQIGSTLTTASAARVRVINGGRSCQVFWQVGSSTTLGTGTRFVGNILAAASITATTGVRVDGRLLARGGATTLDTNVITRATCATPPTTTTTPPTTTSSTPPTTTSSTPPTTTSGTSPSTSTTSTSTPASTTSSDGGGDNGSSDNGSSDNGSSDNGRGDNGRGGNGGGDSRGGDNGGGDNRRGDSNSDRGSRGFGSDSGGPDAESSSGGSQNQDSDNTARSTSTADDDEGASTQPSYGQVRRVPIGAVDTGDGSSLGWRSS
jgi:Ice-binding-like